MEKKTRRRHDAHARANVVCAEHRDFFEATPGGTKTVAKLNTSVTDVDRLLAEQEQRRIERQNATRDCRLGRRTLHNASRLVVNVSPLVKLEESAAKVMQAPTRASDDQLLAQSRAILDAASAYADTFVAEGVPPDHLKNLAVQIDGFAAAKQVQSHTRQQFTAATDAIRKALDSADGAIDVLEGILVNSSEAPAGALVKLRQAKRVGPARVKDAKPTTPVTPASKVA